MYYGDELMPLMCRSHQLTVVNAGRRLFFN